MGFESPVHWLIVILIIALLFGGSRVGSLMGELGKGLRSFKQNIADPTIAPPPPAAPVHTAEAAPVQPAMMARPAAMPPDIERR